MILGESEGAPTTCVEVGVRPDSQVGAMDVRMCSVGVNFIVGQEGVQSRSVQPLHRFNLDDTGYAAVAAAGKLELSM